MKKVLVAIVILAAFGLGGVLWYLGNMTGSGAESGTGATAEEAMPEAMSEEGRTSGVTGQDIPAPESQTDAEMPRSEGDTRPEAGSKPDAGPETEAPGSGDGSVKAMAPEEETLSAPGAMKEAPAAEAPEAAPSDAAGADPDPETRDTGAATEGAAAPEAEE
ncbi:hypothetical protein JMK10_08425 [Rhodovulum sulfidophilum]|uniref:hypothetical protein n=1 Tax=Rhodovulum sulfidophilum TaxID=35806 RepID=UPI0019237307|nr:hypothetical protein [Rhodovulum sulfidophilum]MBL3573067.1 hypothetical protein [Rhodovulum sulfidophilum]MCE8430273.1 hypothetical protein [Rhodovulum sulfidophilum]MCF4116832.1 hypothetical protein [Rhodovulum sulfidophilum]